MQLVDGVNIGVTLPRLDLYATRDPHGEPFLLLQGPEPDHRWRAFAADIVDLARRFDVQLVVSLGAYPAPVPHTRPSRVVATATSDALAGRVGFLPGRMEVPASINAVLERACADAGLDAVGLWAQVPHYVSNFPFPAASAALLDALGRSDRHPLPGRRASGGSGRHPPPHRRAGGAEPRAPGHGRPARADGRPVADARTAPLSRRAGGRARALPAPPVRRRLS